MRPRRFHQYVEKVDISATWRVLHVFCFVGIAISSMEGAYAFCEIYDIFNYRCILYAKVSTKLTDIQIKNETNIKVDPLDYPEEVKDLVKSVNNPKMQNFNMKLNLGIFESDYYMEVGTKTRKLNFEHAKPVPGVPHIYIYDDELWLSNETMTARAHVGMTSTVFATVMMCNFVILIPFIGFVVAAVFTFIVLLFRRTHKGLIESVPADWLYVYPLAIISSTMTIVAVVAFNLVYNGLNDFCARFVHLTGQKRCSPLLDYFTKEQKLGRRYLYRSIKYSQNSFLITTMFWFAQLVVILMRILCTVDFELIKVLIRKKTRLDDENYDEDDYFDLGEYEFTASSQIKLIDLVRALKAEKQDKNKSKIIPDITITKHQ